MTASIRREMGAKRARCRYRIREHLENNGISLTAIAEEMGLSVAAVSAVINGTNHSKQILARLREKNVPEEYLFDPNYTPETKHPQ